MSQDDQVPDSDSANETEQSVRELLDVPLEGPSLMDVIGQLDAQLADSASAAQDSGPQVELAGRFFLFTLGRARFGIGIEDLVEMGRPPAVTKLPHAPAWLRGVTNLRGDILAVADLAKFFGIEANSLAGITSRFVVVHHERSKISAGFLVGDVIGIRSFETAAVGPPTAPIHDAVAPYLRGCLRYEDHMISVLDLDRLLPAMQVGQQELAA